jgi:hypothetical protein
MNDDLDLQGLGQIPDPFGDSPVSPLPNKAPPRGSSPTRADARRSRSISALAVVLFEVGFVVAIERRGDLGVLPLWTIVLGLAVPLAAAALALGAVRGRGRRGLGVSTSWLVPLSTLPPVLFAVATLVANPPDTEGRFWDLAVRCMGLTALLTAIPLALGAFVFRHAFVAASVWRSTALGVTCGAIAAATMSIACWHSGALHVVVGHGTMMIVGGAIGALLGRRITRA